ncbi:hypothetical protein B0T16DRAFT_315236 [Cercophora newfieldiana]|uniref:Nuclear distribution protein n=1 Tax=Cercophora newfieldiana TaxID=92897 RepID=A0AA40CXG2_9PEZI|nr:hypothetical protein B0T16DRAFT_315236 [Cercophora newfieldiana]
MDQTLDKTSLATISLLEARLLRVENIIYGISDAPSQPPAQSVSTSLADLERRFANLVRRTRIYAEILKIYNTHPSLFQPPSPDSPPPTELSPEALRSTVLSYASSFPSTASALAAVTADTPVPDAKLSAELAALIPRMKGIEATQLAQEAEIAELRARSEQVMRAWYEGRVLRYGQFVAEAEGRLEKTELGIRRLEKLREAESAL